MKQNRVRIQKGTNGQEIVIPITAEITEAAKAAADMLGATPREVLLQFYKWTQESSPADIEEICYNCWPFTTAAAAKAFRSRMKWDSCNICAVDEGTFWVDATSFVPEPVPA